LSARRLFWVYKIHAMGFCVLWVLFVFKKCTPPCFSAAT
jgi:hypothetical protein